jgi:hypothetical protein
VLSICGKYFPTKTVGKAFQVKLVERIPIVCMQSCHQGTGWLFEESKIK